MSHSNITKSHTQAKRVRELNRVNLFTRNRDSNYIKSYIPEMKDQITHSLTGPIPFSLPPISVSTISFYRRSNQPIFKTKINENEPLQPHMTYESLWMLAGIEDIGKFPNSQQVVAEFEEELPNYLKSPFKEIRQMAIIAAGNKIIGKPEDILKIVDEDEDQLWVLINHVYERRISFHKLYKFLHNGGQIVFRTIFQMSNNYKDQIIQSIMSNQEVLTQILDSLKHEKTEIQNYTVRIIGNILAQKEEYAYNLMTYKLLDRLYPLLKSKVDDIRKDTCWTVANYVFEKGPATDLISNTLFMQKLIMMFRSKEKIKIKTELYYIFCHLIQRADKTKIFQLIDSERILECCLEDLVIDDVTLNRLTLYMLLKIIDLGQSFVSPYEDESENLFIIMIKNSTEFKNLISTKAFSNNSQISNYSLEIMDKLSLSEGQ